MFDKINSKIESAIDKACGGKDKRCQTGGDDLSLSAIGFPKQCATKAYPYVAPIADCFDVARCVALTQAAMAQNAMYFYAKAGYAHPKLLRALNKCQKTVSDSTADYLIATRKAYAKCWDGFIARKYFGLCPADPDGKTARAILKAESKLAAAIGKACCGPDKLCDAGGDDFTPSGIGFPAQRPAPTPPDGSPGVTDSCAEFDQSTVPGLRTCLRCIADFTVQCVTRIAAATVGPAYPSSICNT